MAFDLANFDKLSAAANTTVRKIWAYTNLSDTLATIVAADYFLDIYYNIDVGDEVFIYGSNGYATYVFNAVSSTSVTVAALAEVPAGSITNNEVAVGAAIAFAKLATLASGNILVGSAGGVPTSVAMTGAITISNTGVTSIEDLNITNADISASAAIAFSKLATLSSANILVGSAGGVPTSVVVSGDVTIGNTGVTAIASDIIVNADINSAAAISFSKLATLASGNLLVGSAGGVATSVASSGDVTIIASGATAIGANKVLSSMVSPLLLKYASVAISAAEFNGMYAAPKLLLAAGGANTLQVLQQLQLLMTYVSANYAAGGVAAVQYDSTVNGAGVIASTTLSAATFQAAASTGFVFNAGVVPETFTTCVNKGLYLSNVTGAFTTGDSTFVAHLWYRTIPTV